MDDYIEPCQTPRVPLARRIGRALLGGVVAVVVFVALLAVLEAGDFREITAMDGDQPLAFPIVLPPDRGPGKLVIRGRVR